MEPDRKIVRVGVLSSIGKLDPRETVDNVTAMVLDQIFEAPYTIATGDTQVKPLLFEPLRAEGRLQYSAGILPGIKFSDGTPLTADLAARSLRGAVVLHNKATIESKGDRVWFTLTTPNPRFDLTLTQSGAAIVLDRPLQVLGTGPFMFEQRPNLRLLQTAKSIRLVRNPHHAKSSVDEVIFHVFPPPDGTRALVEALKRGEVDLTTALTMTDVMGGQIAGVVPTPQPGNSTAFLAFNCERRILGSANVRRGIALALDLHDLAARSFDKNPAAFVAPAILPPMMGRASGLPVMDRDEARRLLDANAKPARLSLLVPWAPRPYMPKPQSLAVGVQKQLGEIGINVELRESRTSDDYFGDLARGNYDLALTGWIADTPDPADFYEALLWSKMVVGENPTNNSRWKNATMDAALARFRENPTEENKREIHRIVREEAPLVPLIYGQSVVVHSRKLRNVAASATGVLTLSGVSVA